MKSLLLLSLIFSNVVSSYGRLNVDATMNYKNTTRNTTESSTAIAITSRDLTEESVNSWSIIVIADFHGAETFSFNPDTKTNSAYLMYQSILTHVRTTYGGDVVLLPGDSNEGKWYDSSYINRHFKGESPRDVVYKASINCYTMLKQLFKGVGYENIHMAIGDHELGDNGWFVDDVKTNVQDTFREGFIRGFNSEPLLNGKGHKFNYLGKMTGTVTGRTVPTTPYTSPDHTKLSYFHQHNNVLIITIDVYEQVSETSNYINRRDGRGGEGTVTGTMTRQHLVWFRQVLEIAREDTSSIEHIIVQAHVPVVEPVRKVKSSAMTIDDGEESYFWKLMRKHGVDLYLCGEVHSTTVTKDRESNLIQIASRGNRINNFLKIEVEKRRLTVRHYNEIGSKPANNKDYQQNGLLVIDKSGDETSIKSRGALKMVNFKKALLRFDFEEDFPLNQFQVVGLKQLRNNNMVGGRAKTTMMRGVTCSKSHRNLGNFGQPYDAQVSNLFLSGDNPISGERSGYFDGERTRFSTYGMGPHSSGATISFSLWIRTWGSGEMVLVHYGAAWSSRIYDNQRDIFSLTIDDGQPKLYAREGKMLTTVKNFSLNDGKWHHIAVSMPSKNCFLSNVEITIDQKKMKTKIPPGFNDVSLFFIHYGRVSLGGLGYSASNYETRFPNWKPFKGTMDQFHLWARPITEGDISWSMKKNEGM